MQDLFVHSGAQLACLVVMKQHSNSAAVQEWGCRALRGLSSGRFEFKHLLRDCGAISEVKRILNDFNFNASVIEEAIGLIACLVSAG